MDYPPLRELTEPKPWLNQEGLPPKAVARATQLALAEQAIGDVVIDLDSTVRIKVNDRCGNTCWFCHNEGTEVAAVGTERKGLAAARQSIYLTDVTPAAGRFVPGEVAPGEQLNEALKWLSKDCCIDEAQLTGGEPPLSRHIMPVIRSIKEAAMEVGMTANGERGGDMMSDLAAAGLNKVNFSIYGLTVPEFLRTQTAGFPERIAALRIAQLKDAIAGALETPLSVRANMVVTPDKDGMSRMRRALDEVDPRVVIRFQPEMRAQKAGMMVIRTVLGERGAHPIRETISGGSSNRYLTYVLPDGRDVIMKHFRYSRLDIDGVCRDCPIDARGECDEGFYGLRLYADRLGALWAGVCMQRMELTKPVTALRNQRGFARLIADQPGVDADETLHALLNNPQRTMRSVLVKGRHGDIRQLRLPGEPQIYDEGHPDIVDTRHGKPPEERFVLQ